MDLPTIDTELATLRAEVTALRAEIAALKGPAPATTATPAAAIRPHREPTVTITEVAPSVYPMPTPDEMARLIDAVARHFPALLETAGSAFEGSRHERREQWNRQFAGEFRGHWLYETDGTSPD
jgi:hypothetical protein